MQVQPEHQPDVHGRGAAPLKELWQHPAAADGSAVPGPATAPPAGGGRKGAAGHAAASTSLSAPSPCAAAAHFCVFIQLIACEDCF